MVKISVWVFLSQDSTRLLILKLRQHPTAVLFQFLGRVCSQGTPAQPGLWIASCNCSALKTFAIQINTSWNSDIFDLHSTALWKRNNKCEVNSALQISDYFSLHPLKNVCYLILSLCCQGESRGEGMGGVCVWKVGRRTVYSKRKKLCGKLWC